MNNSELKARIGVCLGILEDTYGEGFGVSNVVVTFSETEGLFLWAYFSDAPDKPEDFPIYLDDDMEWSTYLDNTVQGYFVCKELPACYSSYSSFKFTYKEFSDAFDLQSARSLEAEQVLQQAAQVLSTPVVDAPRAKALDAQLRGLLGDTDPFWIRWRYVGEKQGWLE